MKKTSNKGFSMVELIIVIAIMAILAAALAPSLIKYINKSRLSTDVQTGTTIATAINAALAVEKAYDSAASYTGVQSVNDILDDASTNEFAAELSEVIGMTEVKGKSKKDLTGSTIPAQEFYCSIDEVNNKAWVWYGISEDDNFLVSPQAGASLAE